MPATEDSDTTTDSPLEIFPRVADVKVMGLNDDVFENKICEFVQTIVSSAGILGHTNKLSSSGKYTSVTLNLYVQSKEQLINVYVELRARDDVLYLL